MKQIITYLRQLHLSDAEANLYLTLLKTGAISVKDLATTAQIKRTTAYIYIDQLIEKGLVLKVFKGSQKQVAANPPESLSPLIKKEVTSAKDALTDFSTILSSITSHMPASQQGEDMEIKYIKGIAGIYNIYKEALAGTEFRLYANLKILNKLFHPNNIGWGYDIFEKGIKTNKKLHIYELISSSTQEATEYSIAETQKKGRYYYKYMPPKAELNSPGILMYNNKVVIINGADVAYAYVLHNKDYYENSVKLFDFIWDVLPGAKLEELG